MSETYIKITRSDIDGGYIQPLSKISNAINGEPEKPWIDKAAQTIKYIKENRATVDRLYP